MDGYGSWEWEVGCFSRVTRGSYRGGLFFVFALGGPYYTSGLGIFRFVVFGTRIDGGFGRFTPIGKVVGGRVENSFVGHGVFSSIS